MPLQIVYSDNELYPSKQVVREVDERDAKHVKQILCVSDTNALAIVQVRYYTPNYLIYKFDHEQEGGNFTPIAGRQALAERHENSRNQRTAEGEGLDVPLFDLIRMCWDEEQGRVLVLDRGTKRIFTLTNNFAIQHVATIATNIQNWFLDVKSMICVDSQTLLIAGQIGVSYEVHKYELNAEGTEFMLTRCVWSQNLPGILHGVIQVPGKGYFLAITVPVAGDADDRLIFWFSEMDSSFTFTQISEYHTVPDVRREVERFINDGENDRITFSALIAMCPVLIEGDWKVLLVHELNRLHFVRILSLDESSGSMKLSTKSLVFNDNSFVGRQGAGGQAALQPILGPIEQYTNETTLTTKIIILMSFFLRS